MNFKNRCKDCTPMETTMKIKRIFKSINIEVVEEWLNSVKNIYSVHLTIKNTTIAANGKGSSREFALASGYGELIERLQNMINFRINDNIGLYSKNLNFFISPDEILTDCFGENEEQIRWFNECNLKKPIELHDFAKEWKGIVTKNKEKKIVNLKYKSIESDDSIMIPVNMVDYYYGTNGMAAGNTKYEALVQALSEILERYTNFKMVTELLTPPDITEYVLDKYPCIKALIDEIESEKYEVKIKDFSLGKNIPSIAVVLFNKDTMEYFVCSGAHPSLEIALERSITELLQGRDINCFIGMTKINEDFYGVNYDINIDSIFSTGKGAYPPSFLASESTYSPNYEGFERQFSSNEEMYEYLTKLIKDMGYNVYYRDESFLGIPSYHIIIPGFSELCKINNIDSINKFRKYMNFSEFIKKLSILNENELNEVIDYLNNYAPNQEISIQQMLYLSLDNESPLNNIMRDFVLMIAYTKNKNYKEAYNSAIAFIEYIKSEELDGAVVRYYEIISTILYLKSCGINRKNISSILSNFLNNENIDEHIDEIENVNEIFKYVPQLKCDNCEQCEMKSNCTFIEERDLFELLMLNKVKYYKNIIKLA